MTAEFMRFIRNYASTLDQNLLPYTPVMRRAVEVLPQYLFPNGQTSAFGDSHYGGLRTEAIGDMVRMAQLWGETDDEARFTAMLRLFDLRSGLADYSGRLLVQVASLFGVGPLALDEKTEPSRIEDYVT